MSCIETSGLHRVKSIIPRKTAIITVLRMFALLIYFCRVLARAVDTASGQQMVCTGTIVRSFVNICRCIHFKLPYNIQPYSQPRGVTGHTFASRWNIYLVALKLANVAIKYIIFIHFLSSLLLIDKSGECREACAGLIDDGWCPVSSPRKLIREQRQRIHPISRTVCHHQLTSRAPTGDPSHY